MVFVKVQTILRVSLITAALNLSLLGFELAINTRTHSYMQTYGPIYVTHGKKGYEPDLAKSVPRTNKTGHFFVFDRRGAKPTRGARRIFNTRNSVGQRAAKNAQSRIQTARV